MMFEKMKYIIVSMRPEQWAKNLFIFAPLVFSRKLLDTGLLGKVTIGFALFSLACGGIYLFNDIKDLESDKSHPHKRKRPLAAEKLTISEAYLASIILMSVAIVGGFLLDPKFFVVLLIYSVTNVAYSMKLKQLVILDVMVIGLGFILRVLAGTALAGVMPSDWLIICTMTISLFLGFCKRRQEIVRSEGNVPFQRVVLRSYSLPFLDQMIAVVTACTVMSYALYTVSAETVARFGTRNLVFTIPFVLYGIFRYLYLVYLKAIGENPTEMMIGDPPFLVNLALWFIVVLIVVY
jgi:4-hydroxybenzoate polyprenyltransferase